VSKPSVIFDKSILAHSVGGITRYLSSLADAVSATAGKSGMEFSTIDVPASHPGAQDGLSADISLEDPFYLKIPFLRRIPIRNDWEFKSRRRRLTALLPNCSIYHASGVQPVYPIGSRPVVTVYDMTAIENPQWHTPETVHYAKREMKLIEGGASVISISKWTANRLTKYMGGRIDRSRICVAGGAADDLFTKGAADRKVLDKYLLTEDSYLLHVGNYVPRKNIPFIIDVHERACADGFKLPLVLVGAGRWGKIETRADNVKVLENITDSDLLNLYKGARALLFPSECEGLGLPALEALACGTPVIASDAGALAETVGMDGVILPVGDSDTWRKEIMHLEDVEYMSTLRDRASGHQRPRWGDAAERVCTFYREMTNE